MIIESARTQPADPRAGTVTVRGDGVVGAAAALALAHAGLTVRVQPMAAPARPARPDVRTYALNAASVALLSRLKVWDALPPHSATAVRDMWIEGDAAGQLRFSAAQQRVPALAWIVDAAALEATLRHALRFTPGVSLAPTDPAPPALDVAALGTNDLLLVCEGRDSAAREALGVDMPRQPYGHSAVAARLTASRAHGGVAWQRFLPPSVLALLPFDQPEVGHGYGLVWSVPTERALALQAAAMDDFEQALNEAAGPAPGRLSLASGRHVWPLAVGVASAVHGPGWALLGDSAHTIHPLAGQGLNLGLADVACLAGLMAQREPWRPVGDPKLLARYARARRAHTLRMTQLTDGLWHVFAHPNPALRWARNQGMRWLDRLSLLKTPLVRRAMDA